MKKALLSAALISGSFCAAAQRVPFSDRTSVVLETVSHHFGKYRHEFNNLNPGIGAQYKISRLFHVGAGVYHNSLEKTAVYGVVGIETDGGKPYGAGLEIGAVTGYANPVTPAALPYVRLGRKDGKMNAKIDFMPPLKNVTPAVVALQLRFRLSYAAGR